jgi:RNA polymerase sigma-70 factor (ECF subfamily)
MSLPNVDTAVRPGEPEGPRGPDALNDEALLAGLAGGDAEAARSFVRRYQGRVYGVAVSVLGDRAMAEDVAQEAFLRAMRRADAFDPRRGTVAAWLLRITRNLAIDRLRLRRPDPVAPRTLAALDVAGGGLSVEDTAVVSAAAARVRAALRDLPAEQSRAVLLAASYGHTAEEISQLENIPVGTAKTRIRLGLRKVRALLADGETADASRLPMGEER